jgi:NodT family efflux transporter outer membrane factor (OMF) lipoprotein
MTMRAPITLTLCVALSACAVGPNYKRPSAPMETTFKEAAGWAPSRPVDAIDKGAWWTMFNDPVLNGLEQRVATSNQTVKQYEAAYRQARAMTAEARAALFPTVAGTAGVAANHGAVTGVTTRGGAPALTQSMQTATTNSAALEASWVPDLWGKVRRTIESNRDLSEAAAADIANARLAAQAQLAEDYFELRVLDEEAQIYRDTVAGYEKYLKLVTDQFNEGTQAKSAVISAQTQLYSAQSSLTGLGVARARMEHAVAVLVGVPPANLDIPPATLNRDVPTPPAGIASSLLERRPDIAASERRMASANAQIGVAVSAYFPTVTLSGDYGVSAANLGKLFNASTATWSLGATGAETILDFGLRRAQVRAARAAYDEQVAAYRQTVLTAFQGVEDELSDLRIYQDQEAELLKTEAVAKEAVRLDLDEYREGTIDYTTVITAQATQLSASINVLTVLQSRLQASVLLVENLGGGWTTTDLPKKS